METTKLVAVVVWAKDAQRPGPTLTGDWLAALGGVVRDFWQDMSGGRHDIAWRVHQPVVLSQNQAEKNALSAAELITAVRQAAADQGQALGDDEHVLAIVDDETDGVGTTATDPVVDATLVSPALVCHELGHYFQHLAGHGGSHADTYLGFQLVDYGDPTCIMGLEGGKHSYRDGGLVIAGSADHELAGPALCPPMSVRTGWLDEANPAAVQDVTRTLPAAVQLDAWRGAPPPDHAGRPTVAVIDGLTPGNDRIYLSLRSPHVRWDQAFPASPGGRPDSASVVAQVLTGAGPTLLVGRTPAETHSWMRLGMAPVRVDVTDGGADTVSLGISFDPWRNWSSIATPGNQPVRRVAAVARFDTADLVVLAADGMIYVRPFRRGFWRDWEQLPGASFGATAGLAVASTSPDTMDLFVVGTDDRVRTKRWNGAWEAAWPVLDTPGLNQESSLAAAATGQDRIELFATTDGARVAHWTVRGQVADGLEGLPDLPPARAVAANTLGDGSVQVHVVTEGANDSRLWSTRYRQGFFDRWFNHGQVPLDPAAQLAAVTEGSGDAYVVAADTPLYVRGYRAGWIGPATTVDGLDLRPESSLAAISRDTRSIDVFAVKPDGSLAAITRSPDVDATQVGAQAIESGSARIIHGNFFLSTLPFPLDQRLWLWATQQVPGPAEQFTIHVLQQINENVGVEVLTKTMVAIEALNGKFLTAEKGGNSFVIARGEAVRDWEKFRLFSPKDNPGVKVLQSVNGYYLSAQGDGGSLVMCTGQSPGPWESLAIV